MLGCWVLSSLSGQGSGRLRSQRPNIALWGEGILITVSLSGTEGEPSTGVAGWVGVPCWQRAGSCHWTKGTRGGGAGLVFAFLSPAYTLQRVSLCSPPPPPRYPLGKVGGSHAGSIPASALPACRPPCLCCPLARTSALCCTSLWPAREHRCGRTHCPSALPLFPPRVDSCLAHVAVEALLPALPGESVLGPVRDLRGFWKAKRRDLGD